MAMIGLGWLILKQAQEALKTGRLEEAHRLLNQPQIRGHKRNGELLHQLMRAYVERGEKHLRRDDPDAAWKDLLKAEEMGITDNAPARLRMALTRLGLAQVRALLETGEPIRAYEAVNQLREKGVRQPELDPLEEAAKDWVLARDFADHGDFVKARETLDRVGKHLPTKFKSFGDYYQLVEEKSQQFSPLLVQLHETSQQKRWREVLDCAEKILALAPQHGEAKKQKNQAWKAIEPTTIATPTLKNHPAPQPVSPANRFILWIDGVGGYLVCLSSRITIGQAGPDAAADIPLFADVGRQHLTLSRDGEGYSLESSKPIQVNNQVVEKGLLKNGDRITLGTSCQILFRQPVAISSTARLDLVSGHKLGLPVDGVLLMAETLMMGPANQAHVEIPEVNFPIILYRSKEGLGVRSKERLFVNEQVVKECPKLEMGSTLSGEAFSLTLEAISPSYLRRF